MSDEPNPSKSKTKHKPAAKEKARPLPLPVAVPKWPFFLSDLIFIGLAYWISTLITEPAEPWQVISILVCAIFGAGFAIAPFYFEYKAEAKAIEIAQLTTVTKEINKMETVAQQIAEASENWEAVQETSAQTAKLAEEIAEGIGASVKEHDAFMAKAGTDELRTLKLEVEKSQQMEKTWANTLVGVLDLVYRLEQSAVASGKENFIETMRQFQGQCREVSRQVGLVAFEAENDSAFDAELHAMPQGEPKPADDAKVSATRLPGFRLQGKLVRKPLVAVG
jgi:molecular chaperone GrpE (heat shock protein)